MSLLSRLNLPQEFLARYDVLAALGEGGVGLVVKVHDRELDRLAAVKFLRDPLARDPDAMARFRREARLTATLVHPNIVRVYDMAVAGERLYVVYELVEGSSLREELARRRFSPREALLLIAAVLDGLETAHRGGVIHRDLKPENILMGADGRPRIADFGIARTVGGETLDTTKGYILGTPAYLAPEVLRGHAATGAADLYAASAVLFELVYGRQPFEARGLPQLISLILAGPPKLPRQAGVPHQLEALIVAGLAPRVQDRPPDAAAFAERARAIAGQAFRPQSGVTRDSAVLQRQRGPLSRVSATAAETLLSVEARTLAAVRRTLATAKVPRRRTLALAVGSGAILGLWVLLTAWGPDRGPGGPVAGAGSRPAVPSVPTPGATSSPALVEPPGVACGVGRVKLWWRTTQPAPTAVRLRLSASTAAEQEIPFPGAPGIAHEALIAGLEVGKEYRARLKLGPADWSQPFSFRTLDTALARDAVELCRLSKGEGQLAGVIEGERLAWVWSGVERQLGRWVQSDDGGQTWSQPRRFFPQPGDAKLAKLNGALDLRQGRLRLYWVQGSGNSPLLLTASWPFERFLEPRDCLPLPACQRIEFCPQPLRQGTAEYLLAGASLPPTTTTVLCLYSSRSTSAETGTWSVRTLTGREQNIGYAPTGVVDGKHLTWMARRRSAGEQLFLGRIALGGGPALLRPLTEDGSAVYSYRLVASEDGTVMAVFAGTRGLLGSQAERLPEAGVFSEQMNQRLHWLVWPPGTDEPESLSMMDDAGWVIPLVTVAAVRGGFIAVYMDFDFVLKGFGRLCGRRYSLAAKRWGPIRTIGSVSPGCTELAMLHDGGTLHILVRDQLPGRAVYWRRPVAEFEAPGGRR